MEAKFYSFTTFKIKWWWMYPLFQWHGMMVTFQIRKTKGLMSSKVWTKGMMTYCTLTCWESKEDMLHFRNRKSHLEAIKVHKKLGDANSVNWCSKFEPYPEECFSRLEAKFRERLVA